MRAARLWCAAGAVALVPAALPHSVTIRPMSRNSVDRDLPLFADGSFPLGDKGHFGLPGTAANGTDAGIGQCNESTWLEFKTASCLGCWCSNGTQPCRGAQSCYWFSQGCSIGCPECTGGDARSNTDLCGSGAKPTICDRRLRTYNLNASCGSADDLHKHNPWRAPGTAPVYDVCGKAGGGVTSGAEQAGDAKYISTKHARLGDLGSKVLKRMPSQATFKAGSTVEAVWGLRANHGGGYQWRLCPASSPLTEACMQAHPLPFVGRQELLFRNDSRLRLKPKYANANGTGFFPAGDCPGSAGCPTGITWAVNPIPAKCAAGSALKPSPDCPVITATEGLPFPPPCDDPIPYATGQRPNTGENPSGLCAGNLPYFMSIVDALRVPAGTPPGAYVLGFRWDAEETAQVWSSCSDITIV